MNTQDELFHDDWRDSLRHLVKALGGCEAVGIELWPTKTRKGAGSWLSDCLNVERPAKLDIEDLEALLSMGRERGCHTAMHQLCDATRYERPRPAAAKSMRTELCEQIAAHAAEQARLARELDRLDGVAELRSLKAITNA